LQNFDGLFNYSGGGGACDDLDAVDLICRCIISDKKLFELLNINKIDKIYNSLLENQNDDGGFCWSRRDKISFRTFFHIFDLSIIYRLSIKDFVSNVKSKIKYLLLALFFKDKIIWKYSNLHSMKIKMNESDIWSTWFRLLSLAIIENTFESRYKKSYMWNMRKTCGLGYFNGK